MPGERPSAVMDRPKAKVAAQGAGERGRVNITSAAVRETILLGQKPVEQQVSAALGGTTEPATLGEVSGVVLRAPSRNQEHFNQAGRSAKTADSPCRVC